MPIRNVTARDKKADWYRQKTPSPDALPTPSAPRKAQVVTGGSLSGGQEAFLTMHQYEPFMTNSDSDMHRLMVLLLSLMRELLRANKKQTFI